MNFTIRVNKPTQRELNFADKNYQLRELCVELNSSYVGFIKKKRKYDKLMEYWRAQLHRGFITQSEYKEKARMFVGYSEKNKTQ